MKTQVDTLSLSEKFNGFRSSDETAHSSDGAVDGNLCDYDAVRSNGQLQKFVGYISYLKFLVTFVVRDVSVILDTLDEHDPITAASFEAAGVFDFAQLKIYVTKYYE